MNVKLEEIKAHRAAKRGRKIDTGARTVIWGATTLVAVAALALGAWSNQTVASWAGIPGFAGWVAAGVIDGIWLVSLSIVALYRSEPWRALTAHYAVYGMVVLSAVTNFGHGLLRFGWSWRGAAAGFLFALLPVALKWLVSVSTKNSMATLLKAPDARNRIRQAGQVKAEVELTKVLQPVLELLTPDEEPPTVSLERVAEAPEVFEAAPEHLALAKAVEVPEPTLVEEVSDPAVVLTDRKARVNDLASKIAERGGALNSVTFAEINEWYGVKAKATASNLRKDAHSTYLANA